MSLRNYHLYCDDDDGNTVDLGRDCSGSELGAINRAKLKAPKLMGVTPAKHAKNYRAIDVTDSGEISVPLPIGKRLPSAPSIAVRGDVAPVPGTTLPEGARCKICNRLMKPSEDCGGDCVECMAKAGDPDCVRALSGEVPPSRDSVPPPVAVPPVNSPPPVNAVTAPEGGKGGGKRGGSAGGAVRTPKPPKFK